MVPEGEGKDVEEAPRYTPLGVIGSENQSLHPGLDDSSGTHETGFQGDIEGALM